MNFHIRASRVNLIEGGGMCTCTGSGKREAGSRISKMGGNGRHREKKLNDIG